MYVGGALSGSMDCGGGTRPTCTRYSKEVVGESKQLNKSRVCV